MSINRTESTANELSRGFLTNVILDNGQVVLDFSNEPERYNEGDRISPKLNFKWLGEVNIELNANHTRPVGTEFELQISTDNGTTWESVGRGGEITIESSTANVTELRVKQLFRNNIEYLTFPSPIEDKVLSKTETIDTKEKLFSYLFNATVNTDNTITPELNEVYTIVTSIDGKFREVGTLLFKGQMWQQELDNPYL